jgi:copper chaperone CopZ
MTKFLALFVALMIQTTLSVAWASATKIEVGVDGMVCGFCAQGITKKFKKNDDVESVKVDLESKKVSLVLKDGKNLSDNQITETLKNAGYSVSKIERK